MLVRNKEQVLQIMMYAGVGVMVIHNVVPAEKLYKFPLSDKQIPAEWVVYLSSEHVSRIIYQATILFLVCIFMPKNRTNVICFIVLEVATLFDFVLRYNDDVLPGGFDINTIKLVAYFVLIAAKPFLKLCNEIRNIFNP